MFVYHGRPKGNLQSGYDRAHVPIITSLTLWSLTTNNVLHLDENSLVPICNKFDMALVRLDTRDTLLTVFTSAFSATGIISRQCVVKTKRIYRTFHYNIQVALLYPTVIYPKMVMSFPDSCKQRMWLLVNRAYTMHVLISARGGEDPSFIIRRPMKLSTCSKKQLTINEIAENTNPRFSAVARK